MALKFQKDGLSAEIAALDNLLAGTSKEEDPVGWLQFSTRRAELQEELRRELSAPATNANIALVFGGGPVFGARGILADFGGKAIDQFQALVSAQYAALDGPVGARGPLPQKEKAQLVVSDVARGSFGFVLEEANSNAEMIDTLVKIAVDKVANLLAHVSSPDEEPFEEATETLDQRVLTALRTFVGTVDDAGATLKVVENKTEFLLARERIALARERLTAIDMDEGSEEISGTLYILPDAHRFELHPKDGGNSVRGSISADALAGILDESGNVRPGIIGTTRTIHAATRDVRLPGRPSRRAYRLLRIV